MSELAADGIPVAVTCRVLKLARQPYYRWRADPVTGAERVEAYRANALFDAHRDDPEFGYRYLVEEARTAGEPMAGVLLHLYATSLSAGHRGRCPNACRNRE